MTIIDADKFLAYLIFSKHIDGMNCGEVKKAIKMCKVDVLDKIIAENSVKTDGDLISRQEVINALYVLCDTGGNLKENPWRDNPHIDAVIETIEQIPSAEKTAEDVKPAKWKRNETSLYYKCSNCKESAVMFPYPYCPLCGSKMTNYAKW